MKELIRKIKLYDHASIEEAIEVLSSHNINGIGVCDSNEALVGFISAKDILKRIYAQKYHNLPTGTVKDYMSTNVSYVKDSISEHDLISKFIDYKYHYYPVVDSKNIYIGTIYRKDLMKYINKFKSSTW